MSFIIDGIFVEQTAHFNFILFSIKIIYLEAFSFFT